MRRLVVVGLVVLGGSACRVVDTIAPRAMALTFEPNTMTVTAQRVPDVLGIRLICNFEAAIKAHGGRPSDYLGLVGVTTTFYSSTGIPLNQTLDMAVNWFGTDHLKYNERSSASRIVYAYVPFSVRIDLKYVDPDAATRVETMTLVCQ